jgi:hypothetical protein
MATGAPSRPASPHHLRSRLRLGAPLVASLALIVTACAEPDQANIQLRKDKQQLQDQLAHLQMANAAAEATIATLVKERDSGATLPTNRVDELFTAQGLRLGRLTGGSRLDGGVPYDLGLKVYAVPFDEQSDAIKAAGTFSVQAFDLDDTAHPLLGTWDFDVQHARAAWISALGNYTYVLRCPWQTVPKHPNLTVKVTFVDVLTGRIFTEQRVVSVTPPP